MTKRFKNNKRMKLILIRTEKGLSQTEVAKELGVSLTTYCFLETGRSNGTLSLWGKIQKVFGIRDEDMWGIVNPKAM